MIGGLISELGQPSLGLFDSLCVTILLANFDSLFVPSSSYSTVASQGRDVAQVDKCYSACLVAF